MPLRVVMLQPSMATYRVPVFRELARRPGIDLLVCYGKVRELRNGEPEGFPSMYVPYYAFSVPGGGFVWQMAPNSLVSPKRCDVLVLSWNVRFLALPLVLLKSRLLRIPTVLWGHGYSKHEHPFKRSLRSMLARLADAVVFYNYGAADDLATNALPRARTFVALNTVDQSPVRVQYDYWSQRPGDLAAFKAEKRLGEGPNLLFVSRLMPQNNLSLALQAVDQIRKKHPSVRLLIVGEGDDEANLKATVARLGIEHNVSFEGAIYDEAVIAKYFMTADAFVYPKNIGLSLIHAMGYGLPVITSDLTSSQNPEIEALVHDDNSLLFAHENLDALIATILSLHNDKAKKARLSDNALYTIRERYNVARMVDGLEAAIKLAALNHRKTRALFAPN